MMLRMLSICAALPLCLAVAHAQETPVTPPPPVDETAPPPPPPAYPSAENPPPPSPPVAEPVMTPPPEQPYYEHHHRHHSRIWAPGEVSITTGAGPTNYFGTGVTGLTDVGAGWDARVTLGTRSFLALEAAYMGSVNNVDMGGGVHGQMFGNGIDGDLRLQLPFRVQPYVFGGVGYNHASIQNMTGVNGTNNVVAAGGSITDDQLTVPAGGGLTGYIGRHTTVDLRGTYRFVPDNGLPIATEKGQLHQWMAQANLGYVF